MPSDFIKRLAGHKLVRQIATFAVVGAIATAIHYGVLIVLVEFGHTKPVTATTIGYCVGIVASFTLNRRFTFQSTQPVALSFAKFAALYGIGMALNASIVAALTSLGVYYLLAQLAATALVLVWNFLGARYVVFR